MSEPRTPRLRSIPALCRETGAPEGPVRAAVEKGELPSVQPGKFKLVDLADFEAWIAQLKVQPRKHARRVVDVVRARRRLQSVGSAGGGGTT